MSWLFVIGAILSAWALLRVIGGERECRLRDLEASLQVEMADNPRPDSPD